MNCCTSTSTVTVRLSTDRKVAPTVRRVGTLDRPDYRPALHNAYGLPAGLSCPELTEFCIECYAQSAERYPSTAALLAGNLDAHRQAGRSVARHAALLDAALDQYEHEAARLIEAGRMRPADRVFRIHWDGDFYSAPYTRAWARVIRQRPHIQFWAYTRSTRYVEHLDGLPNLALYLSTDRYNVEKMRETLRAHPWAHVAYCAGSTDEVPALQRGLARWNRHRRPPVHCPENSGRLPLVVASDRRRTSTIEVGADGIGACAACRLCVDGLRDVAFTTSGR